MHVLRNGVELAYEDSARGASSLVLVHGWGADRSVLQPLFDELKNSLRVVIVDLRGFGQSSAPEDASTIESYADDLAFLCAHLKLEKPIVVGHSMGGMIALDFAARYPEQISGAVILESMVVSPEPVLAGLPRMLEELRKPSYREFLTRLMTHLTGAQFDAALRTRLIAVSTACPQHVLVSALEGMIAFDSVRAASQAKCPLLYVGTNTPYADLARFRQLCPELESVELAGCGHYFPLQMPAELSELIRRFVCRVRGSSTLRRAPASSPE